MPIRYAIEAGVNIIGTWSFRSFLGGSVVSERNSNEDQILNPKH